MPRFALLLEYKGSEFCGWQKQLSETPKPTIQEALEASVLTFFNSRLRKAGREELTTLEVYGSGRTDAGVDALEQVAHFEVEAGFIGGEDSLSSKGGFS